MNNSMAIFTGMSDKATAFRASNLNDWELAAAASLKKLYQERATLKQKTFGERYAIGSPGMVSQYLNGKRPLRLATAIKFSKGLGITVAEISPTLAAQLPKANEEMSINGLLAELAPALQNAPDDVKLALKRIVQTYQADPIDGENKAKAIIALLGPGPN